MTITLPNFCKDCMIAVERGSVSSDLFIGWKKRGCLPAFLQGFTRLIFDESGTLRRDDTNVSTAIFAIRQFCTFYKKVKIECTPGRRQSTINEYFETDHSLSGLLDRIDEDNLRLFDSISRIVISSICGDIIDYDDFVPHHGPGGTADKVSGNSKYVPGNYSWYSCLDEVFNIGDTLYNSDESYNAQDKPVNIGEVPVVRVVTVPKTQTSERVIALEPVVMQMTQQSIKDFLVTRIEDKKLTAGHINFTDQRINQELALQSSITRRLATLDLKSASDRVHKDLVWRMFSVNPGLRAAIFATRSPFANIGGAEFKLNKFASMGSALCFPVESIFFWIVMLVSAHKRRKVPPSFHSVYKMSRDLYVYGDDIICPVHEVEDAVTMLSEFGCIVGRDKSFWLSHFRESCGVDAYMGQNVTPIYMRTSIPGIKQRSKNRKSSITGETATALVSAVATGNLLFEKGMFRTAEALRAEVEAHLGGLPQLDKQSQGLGWRWYNGYDPKCRYNRKLHRPEIQVYVPKPVYKLDWLLGWHALTKCLLKLQRRPSRRENFDSYKTYLDRLIDNALVEDVQHLDRTPIRSNIALSLSWVAQHDNSGLWT